MFDPIILLGLVIGLVVGSFGGGGAILTVPILVHVVGMAGNEATTSSLIIVGATALVGLAPHARRKRVAWRQGAVFGVLGVVGAAAGSALSMSAADAVLLSLLSLIMLAVATLMIIQDRRTAAHDPHTPTATRPRPTTSRAGVVKLVVTATLVGLLSGFFGVGGGWAIVPALTLVLGFSMPVAVGTSLLVMAINSATALMSRFVSGGGHLDVPLVVGFAGCAVIGSLVGARVSRRLSGRRLSRIFIVILLLMAVVTAFLNMPEAWQLLT